MGQSNPGLGGLMGSMMGGGPQQMPRQQPEFSPMNNGPPPGPIANRMKTLQGMIAQYFIMNNVINIEFISACNKLKDFNTNKNTTYSERKKKRDRNLRRIAC
jgi:hypothetical protein